MPVRNWASFSHVCGRASTHQSIESIWLARKSFAERKMLFFLTTCYHIRRTALVVVVVIIVIIIIITIVIIAPS